MSCSGSQQLSNRPARHAGTGEDCTNSRLPEVITVDNGPEFISKAMDAWAYENGIKLHFIQPGKPTQNASIESLNGKLRDKCLNEHVFTIRDDAR